MDMYTVSELAEFLKIHPATLARWRNSNKGPVWIELEGQFRYRSEDVQAWLLQKTRGDSSHA